METSATAENVARQYKAANPSHRFAHAHGNAVGLLIEDKWWPWVVSEIGGKWVAVEGKMPLVNGKECYQQDEWVEVATTKADATKAMKSLKEFIGEDQRKCLGMAMRGEEKQFFFDMVVSLAARVAAMPKTYEQEGLGDQAVIHLHYFNSGCDWWITEKDKGDADEPGQHQAFGLADIGHGGELGYISIVELLENRVELDLYWKPKTLAELKAKREAA